MEFYDFAKEVLVYAGFGALAFLSACAYGYWIGQLVTLFRKKVKLRKEKSITRQ